MSPYPIKPNDHRASPATEDLMRNAFGGGGIRRDLPAITDEDYHAHGREQYARGYNAGAWDVLKVIVIVTTAASIVTFVVCLTR